MHGVALSWLLRTTLIATSTSPLPVRPVYIHVAPASPKSPPPKPAASVRLPGPPAPPARRALLPPVLRGATPDSAIHDETVNVDPCAAPPRAGQPPTERPGCPVQRLIGNGVLFNRDGTVASPPPPDDWEVAKAHNQRFEELDARFGPPKPPPEAVDPTAGPTVPMRAASGPPPLPALVNILGSTF